MKIIVTRPDDYRVEEYPWGTLHWFVSGAMGNSTALTVGRCTIKPGCANSFHLHPNCDEVLHVVQGKIRHVIGEGESAEMMAGDTVSVPANQPHNATNIGDTDAICLISFSTADRKTQAVK